MHDLKALRADPAAFAEALARRAGADAGALIERDSITRRLQADAEARQAELKRLATRVADALRRGDGAEADRLKAEVAALKAEGQSLTQTLSVAAQERDALLAALPNLPAPDVPDGGEDANVEMKRWGTPREGGLEHDELGAGLGFDPEAAARIAGSRFAVLRGGLARLHRALGQFMLDRQVEAGWTEVAPPLLVREEAVFGTGQLPKFAEDLFETVDGRWLIPTAEVSLTNLVRETILDEGALPLRFTALTPCFRREAGAAGRDTRGLVRQHQFDKVELVSIVAPGEAEAEQEHMARAAEAILEALGLPYRRLLLAAGDMGFAARRTFDLEVWLPGAGAWREISSISDCGDFQARRMDARVKTPGAKGTRFVHTLNGSGVAVGRALVAVLEHHQRPGGAVAIPGPLIPYMGGLDRLEPEA